MGHEGGYSNDPEDPGGETNWGISKRSYPAVDIKALTRNGAKAIYLSDFWCRGKMDEFDDAIAFQAFDNAVNMGIETSIRMVQRAAGVADDGHIGPLTIAAVKTQKITDMLLLLIAEELEYRCKLSTWSSYGKGWTLRAAKNLRYAAQDS